ncbi:hypothetical protein ABPG74_005707 [Tetrahymena malaccensis]
MYKQSIQIYFSGIQFCLNLQRDDSSLSENQIPNFFQQHIQQVFYDAVISQSQRYAKAIYIILIGLNSGELYMVYVDGNKNCFIGCADSISGIWYSEQQPILFAQCGPAQIIYWDKTKPTTQTSGWSSELQKFNQLDIFQPKICPSMAFFTKLGADSSYSLGFACDKTFYIFNYDNAWTYNSQIVCPYYCLCQQGSSTCVSCPPANTNRVQQLQNNLCPCINGFYDDGSNINCQICDSSCSICSGNSQNCFQCVQGFILQNNTCIKQTCPSGHKTDQNGNCVCQNIKCLKCDPQNGNKCQTCKNNTSWQLISDLCTCKNAYYYDPKSNDCLKCDQLCEVCTDNFTCQKCINSINMQISNGTCKCITNYYFDSSKIDCLQCKFPCKTCDQSSDFCLTCIDDTKWQIRNGTCVCKEGFYYDKTKNDCLKCSNLCQICTDSTTCLKCENSVSMQVNNGQCNCNSGYYLDSSKNDCLICNFPCKTCIQNSDSCESCFNNIKWEINNFKCQCSNGYSYSTQSKDCLPQSTKSDDQQCSNNSNQNDNCETIKTNISSKTIETLSQTTQQAAYVAIGTSTASSLVFSIASPNGGAVQQFLAVQKLYLLLFLDVAYPQLIYHLFKTLSGTSPLIVFQKINIFNQFIKDNYDSKNNTERNLNSSNQQQQMQYIPQKFQAERVDSSIIVNAGGPIISLLGLLILVFPIKLVERFKGKHDQNILLSSNSQEIAIQYLQKSMKQKIYIYYKKVLSVLTVVLNETVIIVFFFSFILQLVQFYLFGTQQQNQIIKIVFMAVIFLYWIIIGYYSFNQVNQPRFYNSSLQKNIFQEQRFSNLLTQQFMEDYIKYSFLTRNFKFMIIVLINSLVPVILTIFYERFYFQLSIWLAFEVIILVLRIIIRPQNDIVNNIKQIVDSILWVAVLILILILSLEIKEVIVNDTNSYDISFLDKINVTFAVCVMLILLLNPIFLIIRLALYFINLFRRHNLVRKESIKLEIPQNSPVVINQNQQIANKTKTIEASLNISGEAFQVQNSLTERQLIINQKADRSRNNIKEVSSQKNMNQQSKFCCPQRNLTKKIKTINIEVLKLSSQNQKYKNNLKQL